MNSVTEILGGSQILLDISYDIQDVFEDHLTDYHRVFLAMSRVIEDALPHIEENRALTGRKAYALLPFIRAFLAKSFFKLTTDKDLILRIKSDSSLRNICGFSKIPSEASFSKRFEIIACLKLMGRGINTMAEEYHKGHILGHVSRDSTAIAAREKPINKKKDVKEVEKTKKKRGSPKKGEECPPEKEVRLEKQLRQSAGKALKEINRGYNGQNIIQQQ